MGTPAAEERLCTRCGLANPPERVFCRRCGDSLGGAAIAPERVAPPRSRARRDANPWRGAGTFLIGMVAAMVVGAVLAIALVPGFGNGVSLTAYGASTEVRRAFGAGYAPVHPAQASASSQLPGHEAGLAIDLVSNDYWAASATDSHPVLYLKLDGASDLSYVIITSGAGPDFSRLARPRQVQLYYSDGSAESLTLNDDPRPVGYAIRAHNVTAVAIRVISTYPGSDSQSVAIAEVELFRLS